MLDPGSPLPLYHQLASWLEARVREGELSEGARIESEPELARRFGIGRPTVRQATELLVRRGLLERRRGSGTFVKAPTPKVDLFGLGGTLASFQHSGVNVTSRWLRRPTAQPRGITLSRLHIWQRTPVVLEELLLNAEHFEVLLGRDLAGQSLSHIVVRELGLRLDHAKQAFRVARPGRDRAQVLGCSPSTPLLHVRRELCFAGVGYVIEAELFCRTDELEFSQTLKGDQP